VAQAEASHKALLLAYQQAIQNAFADVENALNSRTELAKQIDAQEKLVKAQQNYARLAQLLYDGGYAPYSTVLQAEEQLFPSELNLATIRGQQLASLVNIYKAMGGGWVANATDMADKAQEASAAPVETKSP
jgi:multidrug efflux system outer membrane protein